MDAGYIRVRDQLWLWADSVNKRKREVEAELAPQGQAQDGPRVISGPEHVDGTQHRNQKKDEDARENRQNERSAISSGGGAIFMGNVNTGRDFTYNHN